MRSWRRRTRVRLTLAYGAAFAVVAAVTAVGFWLADAYFELATIDASLSGQAHVIVDGLQEQGGAVTYGDSEPLPNETSAGIAVAAVLIGPPGHVIMATGTGGNTGALAALERGPSGLRVAAIGGEAERVLVTPVTVGGVRAVLVLARPIGETLESLGRVAGLLALAVAALVLGVGAAGYRLSGRALSPVRVMSGVARELSQHDLHRRVVLDLPAEDELAELASTFNGMLERLEHAFDSLQRFTADAAHELRAPLTLMRSQLEVTLRRPRSIDEYEASHRTLLAEVERMSRLADQLLMLARADAGTLTAERRRLELPDLLADVVERWRPLARERRVSLRVELPADGATLGDAGLLRRLLDNLIDNAIRHTPPGGEVVVSAALDTGGWRVAVEDTGAGVDPALRPVLFERFTRADAARGRGTGGAGLGLSLSAAIAQAHGGTIALVDGARRGARFELVLPD
jgi:two-component system OmpR family sensor kinase